MSPVGVSWFELKHMNNRSTFLSYMLTGKTEKVSASNRKLKVNVDGVSNSDCQKVYSSENREIVGSQGLGLIGLHLKIMSQGLDLKVN